MSLKVSPMSIHHSLVLARHHIFILSMIYYIISQYHFIEHLVCPVLFSGPFIFSRGEELGFPR